MARAFFLPERLDVALPPPNPNSMSIFTGTVDILVAGGDGIVRQLVTAVLPDSDVWFPQNVTKVVATASVASFSIDDTHSIIAVDDASAEAFQEGGNNGIKLKMHVAAQNGQLFRAAYQVTVIGTR